MWRLPLYPTRIPSGSDFAILVNDKVVCAGHGNCEYKQGACSYVLELYIGDVVNVKAVEGETAINGIGAARGFAGFLHMAIASFSNSFVHSKVCHMCGVRPS